MGYVPTDLQTKYFPQFMADPNGKNMYFDDWLKQKGYMGGSSPAPTAQTSAPSTIPTPTPTPTPSSSSNGLPPGYGGGYNHPTSMPTSAPASNSGGLPPGFGGGFHPNGPYTGVNDPNFLNQSADFRLNYFKQHPDLIPDELKRDQDQYAFEMANSNTGKAQDAQNWMTQIKALSPGAATTTAPANTPTSPSAPTAAPQNSDQPPWLQALMSQFGDQSSALTDLISKLTSAQQQGNTYSDQLFNKFQDIVSQMNNANDSRWQQYQDLAKQQADATANQQLNSLNTMINQIKNNQQSDLSAQTNNLDSAKQSLEDQTFQKWLGTRQDLANRGVLGSGLRDAAQTQLMLGNNRSLADLYGKTQNAITGINNKYGNQLTDAQNRVAQVNPALLQQQNFQKLFSAGNKSLSDQAKLYSDLMAKTLPYDQFKPGDLLKYQNQNLNNMGNLGYKYDNMSQKAQQFYSNMDAKQQQFYSGLQFKYDNMNSQEKQTFAKLDSQQQMAAAKLKQNYDINMTKIMGVDANGNPTLDAQKLMATVANNQANLAEKTRHDSVSEAIANTNSQTALINANERINNDQATLAMDAKKLQVTAFSAQGTQFENIAKNAAGMVKSLTAQKQAILAGAPQGKTPDTSAIDAQLKKYAGDYDNAAIALKMLANGNPLPKIGDSTIDDGSSIPQMPGTGYNVSDE